MNNKNIIISKENEIELEEFFENECSCDCKYFSVDVMFDEKIEITKEDLEEKLDELYFSDCDTALDSADSINLIFEKNKDGKIIIYGIASISYDVCSDENELFLE